MYNKLTKKDLKKAINEMMSKRTPDSMTIFSGCRSKGIVRRTAWDLNLCNDPNCVSCRDLEEHLKNKR